MNCEEFADNVSDYVEDRLPFGQRVGMWLHAVICPACERYRRQIEWVIDHASDTEGVSDAEPDCPESVKSDLLGKYRDTFGDDSPAPEESDAHHE